MLNSCLVIAAMFICNTVHVVSTGRCTVHYVNTKPQNWCAMYCNEMADRLTTVYVTILHLSTFSSQVMVSQKNTAWKCTNMQFSFRTWNVRGLSVKEKNQQLGRDCHAYKLDLVCIQETKITNYDEITLASGHKRVLLRQ